MYYLYCSSNDTSYLSHYPGMSTCSKIQVFGRDIEIPKGRDASTAGAVAGKMDRGSTSLFFIKYDTDRW